MSRYKTSDDDWDRAGAREEMRNSLFVSAAAERAFVNKIFDEQDDICKNKHGGNAQSVAANRKVTPAKARCQLVVLECLRKYGPLTGKEIACQLDVPFNTISGRCTELHQQGEIRKTDLVRDGGRVLEII